MFISSQLPQFSDGKALLIVAGKQGADFYMAHQGIIKKTRSFRIDKPTYSERAGARVRGRSSVGSLDSINKDKTIANFSKKFNETCRALAGRENGSIEYVYLFASPSIITQVRECVARFFRREPAQIVNGNFNRLHPFDLLKKLA